jgi:hypothetical protein
MVQAPDAGLQGIPIFDYMFGTMSPFMGGQRDQEVDLIASGQLLNQSMIHNEASQDT